KVWVSPYTRAQQTLDIILKYYQVKVPVIIKKELIPSGNPYLVVQQLLAETENNPNPEASLLLVGHNPTLSQVLELICSSTGEESPEMHTSDVALCEVLENKTRLIRYFPRNELIKNGKK
ncbi:MAG: histidine phosphatase family protein, partial [Candidatus Zixiibacteriota bacterium]